MQLPEGERVADGLPGLPTVRRNVLCRMYVRSLDTFCVRAHSIIYV
jgi:hypothetical protein